MRRTTLGIGLAATLAALASTSNAADRLEPVARVAAPCPRAFPACDPAIVRQIALAAIATAP
jgi:hypothetical protein